MLNEEDHVGSLIDVICKRIDVDEAFGRRRSVLHVGEGYPGRFVRKEPRVFKVYEEKFESSGFWCGEDHIVGVEVLEEDWVDVVDVPAVKVVAY